MRTWTIEGAASRVVGAMRCLQGGVLARPLSQANDNEIDHALASSGMTRADLFRPASAVAQHRGRLAWMMAAWQIDPDRATRTHWQDLKIADERCSRCANTGRCQRWLEWGRPNAAPMVFCPNAALWSAFAAEFGRRPLVH